MHNKFDRTGDDPREEDALAAILRLVELDDGSGVVLGELEDTLAALDADVRDLPSVRVAAEPFLAELKLGLGEDATVTAMLEDSAEAAAVGDPVARIVVIRILRTVARMDAVELRGVVTQLARRATIGDPVLSTALDLASAVLDAVAPGAHPLAYPRLPGRFADRVLAVGDPELLCFFADVESAVHGRQNDDLRIAAETEGLAVHYGEVDADSRRKSS
ncbi:hypothetical protein [uncultured Corynebacterium sp.]|uniref:hypothetical protein n=1 Tax=uncultured Corynebacterium sp. TaxID=159447 RepID=UPI0025D382E9|nr:hypothetical protein [uncultured Corynebacterium sp.]